MTSGPGDPFDDALSDHEFVAMARRVRRTADEELSEIEYETERAELKRQDLTVRAIQAMMEGERWQLQVGPRLVDGLVVHAAQDFTSIEDRHHNVHDIPHRSIGVIRVVAVEPQRGRAPASLRPATLVAHLLGLEQQREVELAGPDGAWSVTGTIDSVNRDHVVVIDRTGEHSIIPLDSIGYVGRPAGERRRTRPR